MRWILILAFLCGVSSFAADATIDVIKDVTSVPKVAVEGYGDDDQKAFREKVLAMMTADLKVASLLNVHGESYPGTFEQPPKLLSYRDAGVDYVVRFKLLQRRDRGGFDAEVVRTTDGEKLFSRSYTVAKEERYPFLSHKFVADIARELWNQDLGWMEKFVIFSRYIAPKSTEIVISDYSLTYQQVIIRGGMNIFPKWMGPDQKAFVYTSYQEAEPTLFLVDLYSGERERLISSPGMLVASDVSEDGEKLLVTMAPEDQPDIYRYDVKRKSLMRITAYSGIDVSGNFVDDEGAVVFVSDRLGYPEIFYKKIGSSGVEQMVFKGRNNNYADTWKHYILFVSRETDSEFGPNTFNINLISTKSHYIRQLTMTGKNLFPRFSSTGDTVMYVKHYERETALGIIRLYYNKSFLFPLKVGTIQSIDW